MFIETATLRNSGLVKRAAQLAVVLLCAVVLKQSYASSSPNELRWILTPTSFLVQLVTGASFTFESYAGYINSDRSFVIAASCAGVNFLITAFLMLALGRLWKHRTQTLAWRFIPLTLLFSYLATLIANTVRIATALRLQHSSLDVGGLNSNQLHRLEGILIYFGFLLLLYVVDEAINSRASATGKLRSTLFPLLIYYAITLLMPLANGAYRQAEFWEHSLFVLITPIPLVLLLSIFRLKGLLHPNLSLAERSR